jgi:hypothetical protein
MTYASHYASNVRSKARLREMQNSPGGVAGRSLEDLIATVEQVADYAQDLRPVWPEIGRMWAERERHVFATNGLRKWAPLKAVTVLDKRAEGAPGDTLVRTDTLREELTSAVPRAEGPRFAVFGPSRGAPISYARWHMHGAGVPQRNPVPRFQYGEKGEMILALRRFMFGLQQ